MHRPHVLVALLLTACGPSAMATSETTATSTSQVDSETGTTEATPTTGDAPDPCECADPQVVEGDLDVPGLDGFDGFCIGEVTGRLTIQDVMDPAMLGPLAHLRRAGDLWIRGNPGLVDLSALGCLEQVHGALDVHDNPALVDLDGLARLQTARRVTLGRLPLTALPGFAPGFHGVEAIVLEALPGIVDLDPLAGWSSALGELEVFVSIYDLPALASIAALAGPLGPPGTPNAVASIELSRLPALTAVTGLEAVTRGNVRLYGLPKVESLAPLAALEQVESLQLIGMGLTSLQGLHNLESAQDVQIGGCQPSDRLDGIVDLTGLDALTQVGGTLAILGNPNLVALSGAPMLSTAARIDIVDNPKLGADAVAAFEAQVTHKHLCAGDMVDCGCLGAYPDAIDEGCADAWSGGSAVVASGKAGALDGTTAFFGYRSFGNDRWLTLVVLDTAADIATAIDDGTYYTSDAGAPKLVFETQRLYDDWIGVSTEYAELSQPGGSQTSFQVQVTVTGRLGNWLMTDPTDPPRLIGEFATIDPNAATSVQGSFDAAFCEDFVSQIND
ncbi:MAG TPA: hypothetical protein VGB85_28515 [Nannocystis sp.]|jgi:hypothetical protein